MTRLRVCAADGRWAVQEYRDGMFVEVIAAFRSWRAAVRFAHDVAR